MTDLVKIFFRLKQDEDGYPEVSAESVWAKPTGVVDEYIVDNIPFFIREATIGDTLKAHIEEGVLWFDSLRQQSGNSLIRIVLFDNSLKEKISDKLDAMGCSTEYSKDHNLLAVNIPAEVDLIDVQDYLQSEADIGNIDFEEPILRQS
jgi:hypothetical protein